MNDSENWHVVDNFRIHVRIFSSRMYICVCVHKIHFVNFSLAPSDVRRHRENNFRLLFFFRGGEGLVLRIEIQLRMQ